MYVSLNEISVASGVPIDVYRERRMGDPVVRIDYPYHRDIPKVDSSTPSSPPWFFLSSGLALSFTLELLLGVFYLIIGWYLIEGTLS